MKFFFSFPFSLTLPAEGTALMSPSANQASVNITRMQKVFHMKFHGARFRSVLRGQVALWRPRSPVTIATMLHLIRHAFPTSHFFSTYLLLLLQNSSYPRIHRKSFPLWRISLPRRTPSFSCEHECLRGEGCIIVLHSSLLLKFSPPLRSCDS